MKNDFTCPHCAAQMDLHVCVTDPTAKPKEGDAILCWDCRVASIVEGDHMRRATADEFAEMAEMISKVKFRLGMEGIV